MNFLKKTSGKIGTKVSIGSGLSFISILFLSCFVVFYVRSSASGDPESGFNFIIVDTGQNKSYNENNKIISVSPGDEYYGQDADYKGNIPSYKDNGDGTISDLNTSLMWQKNPGAKITWEQSVDGVSSFRLGGYDDWRLPTIKELYSLIIFTGLTGRSKSDSIPFIDTKFFDFSYGDESAGDRFIDAQYWSSTKYVSTTMRGDETIFGVNFADGRIKGYPTVTRRRGVKKMFTLYVRGNTRYGKNIFVDNKNGTVTDKATGLMWMQVDSGILKAGENGTGGMVWKDALAWAENLDYAGYSDWRLPDTKELQSIVDYSRSPDTTDSAAIDTLFKISSITDGQNKKNYPYYWTSTTHLDGPGGGDKAAYISFGEAMGYMRSPSGGEPELMDVHGAGAQRSDPKSGDPSGYAGGHGPQGDVVYIYNYVRCVRNIAGIPK